MTDFIEVYNNALTDDFCDKAINTIDDLIVRAKEEAPKFDNDVKFDKTNARDDISIFPIAFESCEYIVEGINNSLNKHYNLYRDKYIIGTEFNEAYDNRPKLQKSSKGGGFTQWHCEQGPKSSASRFLVWMFYLNNVEKGGKTEFYYQNTNFKPVKGSLLIWPAAFTHTHRAADDLQEDKYIATGWFHYPKDS